VGKDILPKRSILFCGSDCSQCHTYQQFLAGDESGVVNAENQYRCCWLPKDYPRGRDCPFRTCCEEKGIMFCGECDQFEECVRVGEFYSQPGYDKLRARMFEAIERRRETIGGHGGNPS
jgi:hypothetical protein